MVVGPLGTEHRTTQIMTRDDYQHIVNNNPTQMHFSDFIHLNHSVVYDLAKFLPH